jgi:TP901 family phage tail tape measure protein
LNNIQLNIVANAQFQQVYTEVAKLKAAMTSLQKSSVGGPFTANVTADIKASQSAFDSAVLSTRAFNIQQVAMTDSVTKFGQQLSRGQLSLSNYYKIWRDSAKGTSAEIDALATAQARLNRSIAIADPLKPGYAKLVTDINGVVTAEEKLIFKQQALNTALQQGAMKLVDFGKNTQWMGRQLTVGLTMPLAMFGAAASQAFLQVDQQLTRMQKVYGTGLIQPTQAALKQIRSDVTALGTELARTLGVSVKDTASMAADLAATGLEGAKLVNSTREAIRMATLGELDHQQAMQATISLQNVYKLNTQGLTEAVNFLNAVENQTSTSLKDLVDGIPRVGPIVQQLGGSFKDTAAMMVAMKEAGVPAGQSANAIKSALASLINPTTAATKAFSAYNINLKNIASTTGGNPIMMLQALSQEMKNLDRLTQAQLIEKMFGKFQFARIQALLDNINKSGSQTSTVFKLMGASGADLANVATNELKQQTESASGKFKRMTESLKADMLPVGQAFLNSFTKIGSIVDKVIQAFRKLGNILGPVASLLGGIFGGGLAGLIVIGPIIMLVGLFSNLIGNILRGANAIRMFKQGMESASAGENQFLAGLHGMRNFYQELDTSVIASRNQMDLMPEAITSSAKAFEILRNEIVLLTDQFKFLANAQSSAMGGNPLSSIGTILPPAAAKFLPIIKKNLGGNIPGFANGGMLYDPSKHGSVVPGPSHINYDSVLGSVPKGGFVLNKKASNANSQVASIPRFNSGGSMLAMLTPGEIVIDPRTTSQNLGTLEGLNSGTLHLAKGGAIGAHHRNSPVYSYTGSDVYRGQTRKMRASLGINRHSYNAPHTKGLKGWNTGGILGGVIHDSKHNYGINVPAASLSAVRKLLGLRDIPNNSGRNYQVKGTLGAKLGTDFTSINASMMGEGVSPSKYLSSFAAGGEETSLTGFLKATQRAGVITHQELINLLNTFTTEYKEAVLKLTKINDANNPIGQVASKTIASTKNAELEKLYQQFEMSHTSFTPNVMTAAERETAGLPPAKKREGGGRSGRSGAVKSVTLYTSEGKPVLIPQETFKTEGAGAGKTKGFAHADSSALKSQIAQAIQAGTADQTAYEEARLKVANKNKEKSDPYMASRSASRNSPHKQATVDGKDDATAYSKSATQTMEKESKISNLSKYSIMGRLSQGEGRLAGMASKFGGGGMGMGLSAAGASMALGAVPSKIGGVDISGAKGIASSTASIVSMAAFIPGAQAFLPEIAIGTALFGGIKWAFQRADIARKKFEQGVRDTYSKLETTPDKFITKVESQTSAQDAQANSYKQLTIYGKVYGDTLLKTINGISDGSIKGTQLNSVLTAISNKTQYGALQWNSLKLAIKNAGDSKLIGLSTEIDNVYGKTTLATIAMTRLAMLASTGTDATSFLKQYGAKSLMDSSFMNKYIDSQIQSIQGQISILQRPAATVAQNQQDGLKKQIKAQELIKKNLQDQLKAMQDKSKVIQQQNDYLNKQTDLTQQIKQAEISGNYITAAQLTTQQGQNTAKYKEQQAIDAKQSQVDAQSAIVDGLNAQLQALQSIAAATQSTATNTKQINDLKAEIINLKSLKISLGSANDGSTEHPLVVEISGLTKEQQKQVSNYLGAGVASRVSGQFVTTSDLIKSGAKVTGATRENPQGTYAGQTITWQGKKYTVGSQDPISGVWSISPIKKASGGPVSGPGTWTSDSIPAMLSHGEFVMSADSVNKYGVGMMSALNNKMYNIPGQNNSFSGIGGQSLNQNINFYINGVNDPNQVANIVMQKIKTANAKVNRTNKVAP